MSDYDRNQEGDKEILRKRIRDQTLDLFLAECGEERKEVMEEVQEMRARKLPGVENSFGIGLLNGELRGLNKAIQIAKQMRGE